MNSNHDPMGHAIADYHSSGKAARLRVFSPMFDEDEIPVATLFRPFDDMPALEQEALRAATGDILEDVREQDFFTLDGQFDTILMLMNGIGIVGSLSRLPAFFMQLDTLLAPGGQVLCDSSDICYIFEDEDGIIDLTGIDGYYGELTYQMQYRNVKGEPFPWLFIDPETLAEQAAAHGYRCDIIARGTHYDYLARLTRP